jgi:hypothetical protein
MKVPKLTSALVGTALYAPVAGLQLAHGLMGNGRKNRGSKTYRVEICPSAETEHLKAQRQYAHVFHHPGVICISPSISRLPEENRVAIILHEIGHILAGQRATEKAANAAVLEASGVEIQYHDGEGGKNLEWIAPNDIAKASRFMSTFIQKPNRNKRRNSKRAAETEYEAFHGRGPEVDTIIDTEIHEHSVLPGIGELCWLVIRYETEDGEIEDVTLKEFAGALLCMNEQRADNPQLFIQGGDQRVDLKQFEIGPPLHENETLGRMVCVAYFTTKEHLGEEGGEAEYVHVIEMPVDMAEFKEWGLHEMAKEAGLSNADYFAELEEETEGAQGPDVIYDTRNKLMLLSGGSYTLPDEGIDK